jgi:phage terminase large subunit-like protein
LKSVAEKLASLPASDRAAALAVLTDKEAESLLFDWRGFLARPNQMMPDGNWDIWLLLAGRGFGKTRTGAEAVREVVERGTASRIGLIAETAADARDVMVDAILRIFPKGSAPQYQSSKRRITFANGAVAYTYNATEPDQLRGPQHDFLWHDEIAKWRYARETWDQAQFGLRLGDHPRQVVTTTPRPIELIKSIISGGEGKVHVTRGRTMDNRSNLAGTFLDRIEQRYAGTRLGRQELEAEILGDLPGALWSLASLDAYRLNTAPDMGRIVIAVDPAVTNTEDSDEHGIIAAGISKDQRGIVLEDASLKGGPSDWARRAISLYRSWQADCIVVEVNQGGDMVSSTLRTVDPHVKIQEVRASRGKHVRAEPIAALYEQGKVAHVGSFAALENQMTQMTSSGYEGDGSPDRLDALVWAMTELFPGMVEKPPDAARFEIKGRRRSWMA